MKKDMMEIKGTVGILRNEIEFLKKNPEPTKVLTAEIKRLEDVLDAELATLITKTWEAAAELLGSQTGVFNHITVSEAEMKFKELADTAMELGVFSKEEIDNIIPELREYWKKQDAEVA